MVALRKRTTPLTYKEAGVDVDAGDEFVARITEAAKSTALNSPGADKAFGKGYGATFDVKAMGFIDPILVSSTDGVGTKLRIAIETGIFDTVGIDLVAMCVNDILCRGATPLFFLDYYACNTLDKSTSDAIVTGIVEGCKQANVALLGGETAVMPGFYAKDDFDLAGFAVGAAERGQLLPRFDNMTSGDLVIGLASSEVRSNGFSLVRKIVRQSGLRWLDRAPFSPNQTLGEALLEPTQIYVKSILPLLSTDTPIRALAHITGSAHAGKLGRIIPENLTAHIDLQSWVVPPVFEWLSEQSNSTKEHLLRTFNCGIGMVAIVERLRADKTLSYFRSIGLPAYTIGTMEGRSDGEPVKFSGELKFAG